MKSIDTDTLDLGAFDEVIDVRSPSEFAEDHVPGAVNLPVLDDAQRVEVGTRYKQVSAFEARRLGAGYISKNIGRHLADHLSGKPQTYAPLLYCWRGGQRSQSMAHILERVGWPVSLLTQGYKTYRRLVRTELEVLPGRYRYQVLAGYTGTGKTKILHALAERGEQVFDLEGLANHQGSLLGEPPEGQNVSQKWFESRLWDALRGFDPARPVWTEAESAKIGEVSLPKHVLHAVRGGKTFEIVAHRNERARFLSSGYRWWRENPDVLMAKLQRLTDRYGQAEIERWQALADARDWTGFVGRVLEMHYDPAYARSRGKNYAEPSAQVQVESLLERGAQDAAEHLLAME
ncbi:MAG: tRNA 2-selenouridine(34) synthase MnmH [Nannocystaceae bacterium]|nr:tRNA 2-selenouridine(34) synthase MnmH [Nannocystaceae bacterium]